MSVPRGLYIPNISLTATVTHDDPTVTEVEKIRQSAYLIVMKDIKVEGEILSICKKWPVDRIISKYACSLRKNNYF